MTTADRTPCGLTRFTWADQRNGSSLIAALDGVRAAYLVTSSTEKAEEQQLRFVEAAARAGLGHLVVLSQLGSDEASSVPFLHYHAVVERRVRELDPPFTFPRPNLFFQGLLGLAPQIAGEGHLLYAPIGESRISAVDVHDTGEVAAVALTEVGHEGRTYTVTGPAAITHAEMTAAIATATGREVTFMDIPPEMVAEAAAGFAVPWQVEGR